MQTFAYMILQGRFQNQGVGKLIWGGGKHIIYIFFMGGLGLFPRKLGEGAVALLRPCVPRASL